MYHLSNEEICLACDAAEQFWISGKTEHMEMIRLKLSLEEMLLNYQAHLGRNVEFTVKFKKMLGHRQVLVFLPGTCLRHEQIQQQIAEIRVGPGLAQDIRVIGKCRQLQLLGQQLYLLFSVVNHETAAPFPYRESYASRSTGGTVTAS